MEGKTYQELVDDLIGKLPESQRVPAASLIANYGPKFFEMAKEDAMAMIRRLVAGDLDVVSELDKQLSNDEFIAAVKANTARWGAVANYNVVRSNLQNEFILRAAPIVLNVLLALVGL